MTTKFDKRTKVTMIVGSAVATNGGTAICISGDTNRGETSRFTDKRRTVPNAVQENTSDSEPTEEDSDSSSFSDIFENNPNIVTHEQNSLEINDGEYTSNMDSAVAKNPGEIAFNGPKNEAIHPSVLKLLSSVNQILKK